jgi:hypothetical protein
MRNALKIRLSQRRRAWIRPTGIGRSRVMPLKAVLSLLPLRLTGHKRTAKARWDVIFDLVQNADLVVVCAFAMIGLLLSFCSQALFPFADGMMALAG